MVRWDLDLLYVLYISVCDVSYLIYIIKNSIYVLLFVPCVFSVANYFQL